MKTINRVNLAANTIDQITIFDSEITRWFTDNDLDVTKNLIKINSNVPSGKGQDEEMDRISMELVHYCANGYTLDGITYVPMFAAASDVRKATSTWINREVASQFWSWAMCGLTTADLNDKIAINKYMAYIGLLASASHPVEEDLGHPIDIRRVAVIDDAYVSVSGIMDVVRSNGAVDHDVDRTVEINAFDGFGISRFDTNTKRGPWIKAFTQKTNWSQLCAYLRKINGNTNFVDLWGTTRDLRNYDMIITKSCFKAAKLYRSWEQYCESFEKLGHRICVCVKEHAPKAKGMPYQQGQTLLGDEVDATAFASYARTTVSKYENKDEAITLLPKCQRAVATMYNGLLKEEHTARTIQEKYYSKRQEMLGGRTPEFGFNAFIAPDMTAFAQHLAGVKITGSLQPEQCSCYSCEVGYVNVTRNPHLDNAHVVLNNVGHMAFVYSDTPTMFFSVFDLTTIRLRADYDGDHVWYSQNPLLLNLVRKTYEQIHNNPVDWDVPSAPKSRINKASVAGFISNLLKGSEIGLYADALTKMWSIGYDRDTCNWLTYAGNVLIDAAKHATVRIDKPEAVKVLDKASLPEFCRYAKADKEHPFDSKYWDEQKKSGEPRTKATMSFLDVYSRKVKAMIPETLDIKGIDDEIFDTQMLLIKPDRKIGRLSGLSRKSREYNKETGEYSDGGIFQQIAFRHAAEWRQILNVSEDAKLVYAEWDAQKAAEARKEMIDWAREQYADSPSAASASDDVIFSAVYDIVTRNVFSATKVTEGYDSVIKTAYWRIFGEKAVEVVAEHVGMIGEDILANFDEDDYDID